MALKVFRVVPDVDYWKLLPSRTDFWSKPDLFKLQSMRESWSPLSFYPRDPVRTREGDFYDLAGGALAYNKKVLASELGEIIEYSGEVLPASIDSSGEDLFIFNAMACYNCLDREKTEMRMTPDGRMAIEVKKYAFHAERIGDYNLFKIPETHRTCLYAISGRDGPESEFYARYLALGFTGLNFEEVWCSDFVSTSAGI